MAITREITCTAGNGKPVVVTVEVSRDLREVEINADGQMIKTGRMELVESTTLTAKIDSKVQGQSSYIQSAPKGAPAAAKGAIGYLLLTADNKAKVEAAISSATDEATTPEIADHITAQADARAKSATMDRQSRDYAAKVRIQEGE